MREVSFILMGSFVRVEVWRIKPYISTNGKKAAGVSYQIREGTTQDWKDLPTIIFSPWNCHFLKPCFPQHAALPDHGILRYLGFELFTWRKWQRNKSRPQGNVLEGSMCEDVAISHQALTAPMTALWTAQPWEVYVEFKGNQEVTVPDDSHQFAQCIESLHCLYNWHKIINNHVSGCERYRWRQFVNLVCERNAGRARVNILLSRFLLLSLSFHFLSCF